MVNAHEVAKKLAKLSMWSYFPRDKEGRAAIVEMVCEMISDDSQVDWLVRRMLTLYNEWPGPHEIRACFCSKFRPRDGINAYSAVYLDGIPSERPQIAAPALKLLPDGRKHEEIADPKIERAIASSTAKLPRMPTALPVNDRVSKELLEAATAPRDRPELPAPAPQVITQADIDAAVAENRQKAKTSAAAADGETSGG